MGAGQRATLAPGWGQASVPHWRLPTAPTCQRPLSPAPAARTFMMRRASSNRMGLWSRVSAMACPLRHSTQLQSAGAGWGRVRQRGRRPRGCAPRGRASTGAGLPACASQPGLQPESLPRPPSLCARRHYRRRPTHRESPVLATSTSEPRTTMESAVQPTPPA